MTTIPLVIYNQQHKTTGMLSNRHGTIKHLSCAQGHIEVHDYTEGRTRDEYPHPELA